MSTITAFEVSVRNAISAKSVPGLAVAATNTDGSFHLTREFGTTLSGKQVTTSSTMFIASCTKLITTIAALQLVERGLLALDAPISDVLSELKDIKVIAGFAHNQFPILVDPSPAPTLRHLLTHSSGFTYPGWGMHPTVDAYFNAQNKPKDFTVRNTYLAPLAFHPGTSWGYGASIDVAGLMVTEASGLSLQDYCQTHIFGPLGLKSTVYSSHLKHRPDVVAKLADVAERDAETGALKPGTIPGFFADAPEEHGGAGLVSSVEDYVQVLRALLEPGTLLGTELLDEMFKPQLTEAARKTYTAASSDPRAKYTLGIGTSPETAKTWGLGGGLLLEDDKGNGKAKGTLVWSGMPNLFWFVDRELGLAGLFGMQLMPTDDKVAGDLGEEWEMAVKQEFRQWKA